MPASASRRDNTDRRLARSAWESVPRKNRPVGYGMIGRSSSQRYFSAKGDISKQTLLGIVRIGEDRRRGNKQPTVFSSWHPENDEGQRRLGYDALIDP